MDSEKHPVAPPPSPNILVTTSHHAMEHIPILPAHRPALMESAWQFPHDDHGSSSSAMHASATGSGADGLARGKPAFPVPSSVLVEERHKLPPMDVLPTSLLQVPPAVTRRQSPTAHLRQHASACGVADVPSHLNELSRSSSGAYPTTDSQPQTPSSTPGNTECTDTSKAKPKKPVPPFLLWRHSHAKVK
jgi:hypothetical protein